MKKWGASAPHFVFTESTEDCFLSKTSPDNDVSTDQAVSGQQAKPRRGIFAQVC